MGQGRSVPSRFVGRTDELETLTAAIGAAAAGESCLVLVGGDAGIGKSTFLREAADRAGATYLVGRCVRAGAAEIPFAPLIGLVRQTRRSCAEILTSSPRLQALTDLALTTGDLGTAPPSPRQLFDSTLDLLDLASGDRPAVVVFEDLHSGDVLTWDLFAFLARSLTTERVVLAGTYRPNEIAANPAQRRALADLARGPNVHRFHLAGLGRHDVAIQLQALFPDAPPGFLDDVLARAQGNPLFIEQLAAAAKTGQPMSELVADLLSAEVADLPRATQAVLGVVAVVGRKTAHELLVQVCGHGDEEIEDLVRPALTIGTLVADDDGYSLRHPLIAEVVVDGLLPSTRKRIHRQVADALTADPSLGLSPLTAVGEIAFHLEHAGDRPGSFHASLAAADALEPTAPASAYTHLERALATWDTEADAAHTPSKAERLWQAAELAHITGEAARAVALARAGLEAEDTESISARDAWRHERLGRYLWLTGDLAASDAEYAKAADLLGEQASWEAARVFTGLGQGAVLFCRYARAEAWCRRALTIAEQLTGERDRAALHAERVLALVCSDTGRADDAVRHARNALNEAVDRRDPERALCYIYLADALAAASNEREAHTTAIEGANDSRRSGLERSMGAYLIAMAADYATHLGEWSNAEALLDSVAGIDVVPVTAVRIALASAALAVRRGDRGRAREAIDAAGAHPVDQWHQILLAHRTAVERLAARDWTAAESAALGGWAILAPEDRRWPARFCLDVVTASVEAALDAAARREPVDTAALEAQLLGYIDAATDATSADSEPHRQAAAYLAQARAEVSRLNTFGDAGLWTQAGDHWRQLQRPWRAAYADMRLAEAAAAAGEAARASDALQRANATAGDLGAAQFADDIAAISRRTRIRAEAPVVIELTDGSAATLGLTAREAEILGLVAAGLTNRDIGTKLYVSDKTVSVHVSNIMRKLGVTSRVEAAAVAQRVGLDERRRSTPGP